MEYASSHRAATRGGGYKLRLEEAPWLSEERGVELVLLDDALHELARLDPQQSRIVELRCFGGLSVEETAEVLNVSRETVLRDWRLAKSWLRREMEKERLGGRS